MPDPIYQDPRYAGSRYLDILAGNRPSVTGVYTPPAADYVGAGPTIEFLNSIAGATGNAGYGLLGLGIAGSLGAENYLRAKGRQALRQTAIKSIAQKYDLPEFAVEQYFDPKQNVLTDIQAYKRGNSIFDVLTPKGRQAGRRRKQLEAGAYADLFKTYMGDEGLLSKGLKEDSIARQAAQALFEADPVNAPIPPKASKRYVPTNVPEPGDIKTRFGYQRAAGKIAEGIQPTAATRILGLNKGMTPLKAGAITSVAGIVGKGLGMLAPYATSKIAEGIAGWRADKDALEALSTGKTGPQGEAATANVTQRNSNQKFVIDILINEGVAKGIIRRVPYEKDPNIKIPVFSRDPKHRKLLQGWLGHMYEKVQAGKISPKTYEVFLEEVTKGFQQ